MSGPWDHPDDNRSALDYPAPDDQHRSERRLHLPTPGKAAASEAALIARV